MVCGICSIVFCWGYAIVPVALAIIALILSSQALKITPAGVKNNFAKAGKITGIIGLILGILYFVLIIVVIGAVIGAAGSTGSTLSNF